MKDEPLAPSNSGNRQDDRWI